MPYGPRGMGIVTLTGDGRMMAVLCDGRPSLAPAAAHLTVPSAAMNRRGKRKFEMGKFSTARAVDAP